MRPRTSGRSTTAPRLLTALTTALTLLATAAPAHATTAPTDLGIEGLGPDPDQAIPCRVGPDRSVVFTQTPRLRARIQGPGGTGEFEYAVHAGTVDAPGAELAVLHDRSIPLGVYSEVRVPAGVLSHGGFYTWRVRTPGGEWSSPCEFEVDSVKPDAPLVSSTDYPEAGDHGGPDVPGTFTFRPGGPELPVAYVWGFGSDPIHTVPAAPDGTATLTTLPRWVGANHLVVQAEDRAGNRSPVTTYWFSVTPPQPQAPEFPLTELHRYGFNETEGATTADSITGATTTLPGGVTRVPGRNDNKRFLNLDGTAAITAPTTGPRGDQPFTVTAWARPADLTAGGAVVVLGDPSAPLASLGYQASTGKWFATGTGGTATAFNPTRANRWAFLVAVHDHTTGTVTLYVDGVQQNSAPWTPTATTATSLLVGEGWKGDLDDVRVFSGAARVNELRLAHNSTFHS
ncbi:LamG domain-containing protein [Actinosynnema pretiosum subsp. pretiosum]|uniref:LamG domain-containing protein n=1 Tax=Actinosynnema pretiosum subsp. pretiosum TaxID=103721 RepID=A0AA45LBT1_9PSEU|nr:putative large secreted protein [Actinosynnema pretiosum subsp. pretiosum]QUF07409.1 LamG domain-containing protein [Actinosynnema pretiosum subsp. pretiosum]